MFIFILAYVCIIFTMSSGVGFCRTYDQFRQDTKWIYLTLRTATQQVRYLKSPTKISSDLEKTTPRFASAHLRWLIWESKSSNPPTHRIHEKWYIYLPENLYKSTVHVGVLWESTSSLEHENPLDNSSDRLGGFWTCEGLGGLGNGLLAVHPGKSTWNIK